METKKIIGGVAVAGALAGGAILGGIEMQKEEVRDYRRPIIERLEFTKNNQDLCRKYPDERCATLQDFQIYVEEANKVKNVKTKGKGTFDEIMKAKMLK